MTVSDLIEKLRQVPPNLEVHVMADLQGDLADIASVDLITQQFADEPFVVIDLLHENPAVGPQDPQYSEPATPENQDYSPVPKPVKR
jgi:hypothetical protein